MQIEKYINILNIELNEDEEKIIGLLEDYELSISMYFLVMKIIKKQEDIRRERNRKKYYENLRQLEIDNIKRCAKDFGIGFDRKEIQNFLSKQLQRIDEEYKEFLD